MEEFCDCNGMVVMSRETSREQKTVGLVSVVIWVVAVFHCHLAAFKVFGPPSVRYLYSVCTLNVNYHYYLYVLVAYSLSFYEDLG